MHSSTAQDKISSPMFSAALEKQAHSIHYVSAVTPMEIWSSYRCAVSQHQCTAALLRAEQAPQCSVLVWTTGSQHTLGLCSYTYGDLSFIQVCSEPAPMHCSTDQGKIGSPVFSGALEEQAHSMLMPLQLHLCRFGLHTGVQ